MFCKILKVQVPRRILIGLMVFSGSCINFMLRVNLSVNIVAMVPASNTTSTTQESLGWSAYERAHVLGGYFWGYAISSVLGGPSAERWGARLVVCITTLVSALLTLLSPPAAKHSYFMMLIIRILLGFFSGFHYPSFHALIAQWAVPTEKGKFLGAMIFGTIGTVVTWSLCGIMIETLGWEWGFHTFGMLSILWSVVWWFCVYDGPSVHPRITTEERQYISERVKDTQTKKPIPPYRHILTSIPVWSLLIFTFGNGWGNYFTITAAPNFIANALGYKISSTGFLSSMVYMSRAIFSFLFGSMGDFILQRNILPVRVIRKIGCMISHIFPGCILIALTHPSNSAMTCIVLMMVAMGLNGAVTISCTANSHDLTRNFAGTVSGMATAVGTIAGIITPLVTAYFTKDDETNFDAWRPVFYTGALVYMVTGFQFLIFGSTETQPWNVIDSYNEKGEKIVKEGRLS